jgi:hypothetical protein
MITPGYRARWQGTEYEASPDGDLVRLYGADPAPGFDEVRPGRYRRIVPTGELEWFGYLHVTGRLDGAPVILLAERGDELLAEYVGGRAPVGQQLGLPEVAPGVFRGWVPRARVADVAHLRTGS